MANFFLKHWTKHYNLKMAQNFWDKLRTISQEDLSTLNPLLQNWKKKYGEINSLFYLVYEHDVIWIENILPHYEPVFNQLNEDTLTYFKHQGLVIADSAIKIKEAARIGNLSQVEYLYDNYLKVSRLKIYNGFYGEDVTLAHYHEALVIAAENGFDSIVKFLVDKQQEKSVLEYAFYNTLKLVTIKNDFPEDSFSTTIHCLYYLIEGYYELTEKNIVTEVKARFKLDESGLTDMVMAHELDYFTSHHEKVEMAYQMIRQLVDNGTIKNDKIE